MFQVYVLVLSMFTVRKRNALQFIYCYYNSTAVDIELPLCSQKKFGSNFVMLSYFYYGTICYQDQKSEIRIMVASLGTFGPILSQGINQKKLFYMDITHIW